MNQGTGNGFGAGSGKSKGTGIEEKSAGPKKVVDFNQARELRLEEKRRRTERIFFKNLVSVFSVIDQGKMSPIEVIDVSEDGCSFQLPFTLNAPQAWPQKSSGLPIRLYFSQDTYLEIFVQVENSRAVYENNTRYVRYGCSVDKELTSYPAFKLFVQFLRTYAEHSHKDNGDVSIFYT